MTTKSKTVFYSIQEVADILELSVRTIRRHIHAGYLPAHRIGHQYRISDKDLERYLRAKYTFSPPDVL